VGVATWVVDALELSATGFAEGGNIPPTADIKMSVRAIPATATIVVDRARRS
jgi:hypothetical protein